MRCMLVAMIAAMAVVSTELTAFAQKLNVEDLLQDGEPAAVDALESETLQQRVRPAGTFVRPNPGAKHPVLDKAWADYDTAVAKLTEDIRTAIAKQFDAATAKGDLDEAEKWQTVLKEFEDQGQLPDENATKSTVATAVTKFRSARDNLKAVYEELVKTLTIEKNIAAAKQVRGEWLACLASTPASNAVLKNSIGIELKFIPAGNFIMGQEGGFSNGKPHRVTLTKPFYIGVYEVTNAQWRAVMQTVPSLRKEATGPVEQVSREDALQFCLKLSALPAERAAGRTYRLPTAAEWEYACRAGTSTAYSFGDDQSLLKDYGWFKMNSEGRSQAVGTKKPNAWGLYDMHGNVWEWCSDYHGEIASTSAIDPHGPASGSLGVIRGGCWDVDAVHCLSAGHYGFTVGDRNRDLGFRLALGPSKAKPSDTGE